MIKLFKEAPIDQQQEGTSLRREISEKTGLHIELVVFIVNRLVRNYVPNPPKFSTKITEEVKKKIYEARWGGMDPTKPAIASYGIIADEIGIS